MCKIPQIAQCLQTVLTQTADQAAYKTGFTQRRSKLTGSAFVQSLVFGWLSDPDSSLERLCQLCTSLGVDISAQGLDQRFSPQSAACLYQVLEACVSHLIRGDKTRLPVLRRFRAVYIQDSTTILLPDALHHLFDGGSQAAGVKLQVRIDYLSGLLEGPFIYPAKAHDCSSRVQALPVEKGALRLADLGYFNLSDLRRIDDGGGFYLTRLHGQVKVLDDAGDPLDVLKFLKGQPHRQIQCNVLVGDQHRLPARLIAVPVASSVARHRRFKLKERARKNKTQLSKTRLSLCDWTLLITNAPPEMISVAEAQVLASVRWQIELLFKLWKSQGRVDKSKSQKPWRVLTELYAKLIGVVIQHWVILTTLWKYPNRSLVKAAQTVRTFAVLVACALPSLKQIAHALRIIKRCLERGCRINTRRKAPNTCQKLEALTFT